MATPRQLDEMTSALPLDVRLFPATTQRLIELHKALVFVVSCLRQGKFGTEQGPLAIKNIEISCCAASIAHKRYVDRFLQIFYRLFLALADHVVFVIANQRIRDIAECVLNGLLVTNQSLPLFRFGVAEIVSQCTTLEDRLCGCRRVASDPQRRGDMRSSKLAMPKCRAARAEKLERLLKTLLWQRQCWHWQLSQQSSSALWMSGLRSSNCEGRPVGN